MFGRRRSLVPLRVGASILVGVGHLELVNVLVVDLLVLDVAGVFGVVTKVDDGETQGARGLGGSLTNFATMLKNGTDTVKQSASEANGTTDRKLVENGAVSVSALVVAAAAARRRAALSGKSAVEARRVDIGHFASRRW